MNYLQRELNKTIIFSIFTIAISITIYAVNINDTQSKRTFMQAQDSSDVAKGMGAYQIDTATANTTLIRYKAGDEKVFIKKIYVDGNLTTITKAFALWENRGIATYIGINE